VTKIRKRTVNESVLIDLGNQFNSLDDNDPTSSKRIFLKKILNEVGKKRFSRIYIIKILVDIV
jgi:hypothetical protein